MRKLSSSLSPRSRWGPVLLVLGGLLFGVFQAMENGFSSRLLLQVCGVVVFAWVIHKMGSSDLAEEVQDLGDHLVVRRGNVSERIQLSNLRMVEVDSDAEVMTLHFVRSTAFGRKIAFNPTASLRNPFREHPLVEELMNRAHAARL